MVRPWFWTMELKDMFEQQSVAPIILGVCRFYLRMTRVPSVAISTSCSLNRFGNLASRMEGSEKSRPSLVCQAATFCRKALPTRPLPILECSGPFGLRELFFHGLKKMRKQEINQSACYTCLDFPRTMLLPFWPYEIT